ncbi:hypothetical protein N7488_008193 [Penicillium malachiteum]|nr:hypothetical protein N7488_008193 [Penicillium malachiteum]
MEKPDPNPGANIHGPPLPWALFNESNGAFKFQRAFSCVDEELMQVDTNCAPMPDVDKQNRLTVRTSPAAICDESFVGRAPPLASCNKLTLPKSSHPQNFELENKATDSPLQCSFTPWEQAIDNLRSDPEMKKDMESFEASILQAGHNNEKEPVETETGGLLSSDAIKQLQDIVNRRLEDISNEGKKTILSHNVDFKAFLLKSVTFIQQTQSFISTAIASDPHASLAWAGALLILPILTRTVTGETEAVEGFNYASRVLTRCRAIEENYFSRKAYLESKSNSEALKTSAQSNMIKLYTSILQYEIRFSLYLSKGKGQSFLSNFTLSDDWSGFLKDIKAREEEIRKDVEAMDSVKWKSIESSINDRDSKIKLLLDKAKRNEEERRENSRYRLRQTLESMPFATGAAFNSGDIQHSKCLPNTRMELLQSIMAWAQGSNDKQVFWLKGVAGTGKSTIAKTVATELDKVGGFVGSFFFARGEGDRANRKMLVTSIAKYGITDKTLVYQWEKLIRGPLCESDHPTRPLVLVIDALDESVETDIPEIIQTLTKDFNRGNTKANEFYRVLITSRPETVVRSGFSQTEKAVFHDLALEQEPEAQIKRDIRTFINDRESLKRILDANKTDSSTEALNKVYAQVLENYLRSGNVDELDDLLITSFQQIVGTIITLSEPLSVRSLAALLDTDTDRVWSTIQPLYSVLDISDDSVSSIKIFHQSFRDFLIRQNLSQPHIERTMALTKLSVNEKEKHRNLASECLKIMAERGNPPRRNICELPHDGMSRNEVDSKQIEAKIGPELRYACRYWPHHLVQGGVTRQDAEKAVVFFREHLLHWLEVMSILGFSSEVILSIIKLKSLVKKSGKEISDLEFIEDAERFALRNRAMMDIAPLQLYSSGLIFVPESCIVRNAFKSDIPEFITQLPSLESDWGPLLQTLDFQSRNVGGVQFSADGHTLYTGQGDGTFILWDTATGALLQEIGASRSQVY